LMAQAPPVECLVEADCLAAADHRVEEDRRVEVGCLAEVYRQEAE
jgi:hypothetical protein